MRRNCYIEFTTTKICEPPGYFWQPHSIKPPQTDPRPRNFFLQRKLTFFVSSCLITASCTPLKLPVKERNKTKNISPNQAKNYQSHKKKRRSPLGKKKEYMIPTVPVIANPAHGKDVSGVVSPPLLLLIMTSRPDIPICSSAMVGYYPHILRWN